jgi:hypothetical protein
VNFVGSALKCWDIEGQKLDVRLGVEEHHHAKEVPHVLDDERQHHRCRLRIELCKVAPNEIQKELIE